MYEVIVLGATFAAAGIAHKYKEKCLVLERRMQAGYEFFGSLYCGVGSACIYPCFQACHTVFGTGLVEVKPCDGGFACVTHGIEGFRTYKAKRVVDTRCNGAMSLSKTYNLLIESKETPAFSNVSWEKAEGENRYVLRCPVPLACGYTEARAIVQAVVQHFSETQRLILSADEFDYQLRGDYPRTEGGILYLPSKAYEDPARAFAAGEEAFK